MPRHHEFVRTRLIFRGVTTRLVIITKRGKVLARLVADHGKGRGLGRGRHTVEITCSDEQLFRLGAGEPWDAGPKPLLTVETLY